LTNRSNEEAEDDEVLQVDIRPNELLSTEPYINESVNEGNDKGKEREDNDTLSEVVNTAPRQM